MKNKFTEFLHWSPEGHGGMGLWLGVLGVVVTLAGLLVAYLAARRRVSAPAEGAGPATRPRRTGQPLVTSTIEGRGSPERTRRAGVATGRRPSRSGGAAGRR